VKYAEQNRKTYGIASPMFVVNSAISAANLAFSAVKIFSE